MRIQGDTGFSAVGVLLFVLQGMTVSVSALNIRPISRPGMTEVEISKHTRRAKQGGVRERVRKGKNSGLLCHL